MALLCRIGRWLPGGHPLPDLVWARRHRGIVRFALLQALGVGAFGFLRGFAVVLCVADVTLIAFPALLALSTMCGRRARTVAATFSLMMASVTIVDFAGGVTEAHFHFFVMVGVVALYQDWTAFGVCILITVIDHAVMGILLPDDVYGTPAEQRNPILWAFIHGAFVLALAFTQVLAWHYIEEQSLSDTLTGLPNRRAFTERLAGMAQTNRRPLSVLILDFDHFKNINDSYGHTVGDNTLRAAAQRISACARQGDLLARLGGDEFVILVQGPDAFGPALAARIHDALQTPVIVDGVTVFVRASIGIASVEQTGSRGIEDLMRCADLAMYMAKSNGRNTAVVYDAHLDQAVRERAELAAALQPALEDGQMSLAYQPVVTGADGTMIGVEALARWQHPTLGPIGPATFMPLAEETGDIIAIGLWALQTAAAQAVQWNVSRPGGTELTLAVNVSPVQIGQADFVASVLAALELSGLPPASLILEVTEGLRLHDWTESCARLNELRRLGVRVAIDDFGTGYSSLSYLADLPADIVKIDQSFVRDLLVRASAVVLVRAVMDLATSLGLDVIAEGVESQAQQTVLTDLGCPHSQGYFHSPPLSAEDLTHRLDPSFLAVPAPVAAPSSLHFDEGCHRGNQEGNERRRTAMRRRTPVLTAAALLALTGCGAAASASPHAAGSPTAGAASTAATSTAARVGHAATITTTGTGTVSGTPNVMTVQIGVENTGAHVATALRSNNLTAAAVQAAFVHRGVALTDIQTSQLSLYTQQDATTSSAIRSPMR